jgi:ankyrin repeat protein
MRFLAKEHGADVNKAYKGCTPLFYAAQSGHVALARFLGKELGADVDKAVDDKCTPLFVAVQNGHPAVVLCLVKELGADVNKAIDGGRTPLSMAASANNLDMLRYLEEFGADGTWPSGTALSRSSKCCRIHPLALRGAEWPPRCTEMPGP